MTSHEPQDGPAAPQTQTPVPFPVRAMQERSGAHPVISASGRREGWLGLAAAVGLAGAIALGALYARERNARARESVVLGNRLLALESRVEAAERDADERQEALDALTGPGVREIALAPPGAADPTARVYQDARTHGWTLLAWDLAAPASGRTYQLWLTVGEGQDVSAGTFEPDAAGRALLRATYEPEGAGPTLVSVTEEPVGGSLRPTGRPMLRGRLK